MTEITQTRQLMKLSIDKVIDRFLDMMDSLEIWWIDSGLRHIDSSIKNDMKAQAVLTKDRINAVNRRAVRANKRRLEI